MSGVLPARLGKYEIRGALGRGAMGTVYDGWDPVIERRVAIKTVRLASADDEEAADALARFKREAQAAGRLVHPNIVGVFDYGETDELAFIVMEFVDGRSLKEELAGHKQDGGGRMAAADAVRLMEQVLAGLAYSHGRGVVHRDIKPANIMLTRDNEAKIADFGIARIESSSMTQAGTVMGTPAYMSPEQFRGEAVDRRTDIYSCGVVLFQLLTGERPFEGSMASIMHKATTTTPPRPSDLAVTAPPELDAVVARAMAKRPADRFDTAAEFAQALRAPPVPAAAVLEDDATTIMPGSAAPAPPAVAKGAVAAPPPATTAAGKARAPLGPVLGGAGVVLAGAGALAWFLLSGTPPVAPKPSQQEASAVSPHPPTEPSQQPQSPVQPPATTTQPSSAPFAVPPGPVPAGSDTPGSGTPPVITSAGTTSAGTTPPAEPEKPRETASAESIPPLSSVPGTKPTPVLAQPFPAATLAALDARLPGIGCSLLRAGLADGTVRVSGLVGTAAAASALRDAASLAAIEDVRRFDGPYCAVLDLLRALPAAPGLVLQQDGGPVPLQDNQVIALHATMPGFAGFLHLAYVQHDEHGQHDPTVSPLVPGPGYPAQTYPARAVLALGSPRKDSPGWKVGPPFGTDMIVAVASTAPLFSRPPPDDQPLPAYLASLRDAIEGLRRRGGTVAVTATTVDTVPGR